jgi:hypothetical protein
MRGRGKKKKKEVQGLGSRKWFKISKYRKKGVRGICQKG